jgi:hypothetical protein
MNLFSEDLNRIKNSLEDLIILPSNNFRVYKNGECIVPELQVLVLDEENSSFEREVILNVISSILYHSNFLKILKTVQERSHSDVGLLDSSTDFDVDSFVSEQFEYIVEAMEHPPSDNQIALGRFLISMTLKDLSFIVQLSQDKKGHCPSFVSFRNRSEGIIPYQDKGFHFRIIPIDLDQKFWKSLPKWEKLEEEIKKSY